jgi:hypothetical protein
MFNITSSNTVTLSGSTGLELAALQGDMSINAGAGLNVLVTDELYFEASSVFIAGYSSMQLISGDSMELSAPEVQLISYDSMELSAPEVVIGDPTDNFHLFLSPGDGWHRRPSATMASDTVSLLGGGNGNIYNGRYDHDHPSSLTIAEDGINITSAANIRMTTDASIELQATNGIRCGHIQSIATRSITRTFDAKFAMKPLVLIPLVPVSQFLRGASGWAADSTERRD